MDGGKADGVCPKHSPPGSLSAQLPTPARCHSFLRLKIIGNSSECVRGAATSEAGNVAVPAPCPCLWCVSLCCPLGSPEVSCRLAGIGCPEMKGLAVGLASALISLQSDISTSQSLLGEPAYQGSVPDAGGAGRMKEMEVHLWEISVPLCAMPWWPTLLHSFVAEGLYLPDSFLQQRGSPRKLTTWFFWAAKMYPHHQPQLIVAVW